MKKESRLIVPIVSLALVAAGCGQVSEAPLSDAPAADSPKPTDTSASDEADQLYEASGLVLDEPSRGPELCLGVVNESLPPQCEGIPLSKWDWTQVEGEESVDDTTWGDYHLVGNYDGETFSVREVGPPQNNEPADSDPIGTPCPEPSTGWSAPDPDRASEEDVAAAQREVSRDEDFAGLWIDYYNQPPGGPTEEDPGDIILNVAFTEDLSRHERELRELWGGPLCVTGHEHTVRELQKIQKTFPADEFNLDTLWSDIDVVRGFVEIGVVAIDAQTLQRIEDRYGEGVVRIDARLKPAE